MNHILKPRLTACLAVGLAVILLISEARGWGPGGHMIVAQIAYGRLNARAKAEVDRLIGLQVEPMEITKRSLDFVNAAHWPDDIRPIEAFKDTIPLHFVDFPFSDDGTPLPAGLPEQKNIITALTEDLEILKSSKDDNARAQALRFIIHFVGDIHQPLHCATRVTQGLPEGDRGGNSFSLRVIRGNGGFQTVNLHSYWDGGIGDFPKAGPNFAPPPLEQIEPAVERITAEFPDTDDGWKAGGPANFAGWAKESTELAKRVAYEGMDPNSQPTREYNQTALHTVRQRVAWGGYRLAELLNSVWPEQQTGRSPDSAEEKSSPAAQPATWRFVVSGDSRDCGDLVMPAIAADALKRSPAFYWHLGDYRAIYRIDEDMENLPENPSSHFALSRYEKTAWDDFLKNQISPFGSTPVFLGIGNHEMILHKDREDFIAKFRAWLDAPILKDQRLKDDPTDYGVKTYFHWTMGGVDFISMDNASPDQFDEAQMKWFSGVLTRDKSNAQIQTLVVGMHAALPESISRGHSMSESLDGEKSGIQVYKELLSAQNDAHKRVYVLASHSHFFMDGTYNTEYWRQNGGVLPGWIVGTAGAVRYPLPENWRDAQQAMTKVYGYLLATVNPDDQKDGTIRFEFQQLAKQEVPARVAQRFKPSFVDWCFEENVQVQKERAKVRPTKRLASHQ